VPGPGLGRLPLAEFGQCARIGPVDTNILGLTGIGHFKLLAGQQSGPKRSGMDVIHGRARAQVHLGRAAVEAGQAVRPKPGVQIGVVAGAEEWLWVPTSEISVQVRYDGDLIFAADDREMARMLGSANAAFRSAARAVGEASSCRVVGNSTGTRPVTSARRCMACSCTAGNAPGAAKEGDSTAMRSPGSAFGG
jgi:hypothetical protein